MGHFKKLCQRTHSSEVNFEPAKVPVNFFLNILNIILQDSHVYSPGNWMKLCSVIKLIVKVDSIKYYRPMRSVVFSKKNNVNTP